MKSRLFESEILFEEPLEKVFDFFCDARNLENLTPPWLHFTILTEMPVKMDQGTFIDYQLRLYGAPVRWRTEITQWNPPHMFEDTQVRGPYRSWIHKHIFEETERGTLMRDRVTYASPGWFLEPLVHHLFVKNSVRRIFDYRRERFSVYFNIADAAKAR